jgi:hypothetical protein
MENGSLKSKMENERSHANVSVHMAPEKLAELKLSFPFVIFQISKAGISIRPALKPMTNEKCQMENEKSSVSNHDSR